MEISISSGSWSSRSSSPSVSSERNNPRADTSSTSSSYPPTIPAAESDPTDRYVYLSREEAAKKLFKKLVKQLIDTGQPPAQERTDELKTYSDVMTLDKVFDWKYAEGLRGGILWDDDTSSLTFIELPGRVHEIMSNAILDKIKGQFPPDTFETLGSTSEFCL